MDGEVRGLENEQCCSDRSSLTANFGQEQVEDSVRRPTPVSYAMS